MGSRPQILQFDSSFELRAGFEGVSKRFLGVFQEGFWEGSGSVPGGFQEGSGRVPGGF